MKNRLMLIGIFGSLSLCHAQSSFTADFSGSQEVPQNSSAAYGSVVFTLNGTTLSAAGGNGAGEFGGLIGFPGAITVNDAAPGSIGPALFDLEFDAVSSLNGMTFGSFGGSGTLDAAQITDLDAGNLYVNFEASGYPDGEMRGQIEAVPEPSTLALLAASSPAVLAGIRSKRHGSRI